MKVQDYSVTKEFFELVYNKELDLYATHPQPNEKTLPEYYKSQEYISHTDSKSSIFDRLYQTIKQKTLKNKLHLIEKFNQNNEKTLLDIGCGTGDFLFKVQNASWEVVGVEPNNDARNLAQNKLKSNTKLFQNIDAIITDEFLGKFQIITLWHVLEHVPNYDEYISKIKKLLHPQGTLIVAVPNFNSFDAKYYKSFWAAFDVPRHLWHFSRTSIKTIFHHHNMKVVETKPMLFDSFYVALLSEKYLGKKWNIFRAFFVGLLSNIKASKNYEYSSLIYVVKIENTQN